MPVDKSRQMLLFSSCKAGLTLHFILFFIRFLFIQDMNTWRYFHQYWSSVQGSGQKGEPGVYHRLWSCQKISGRKNTPAHTIQVKYILHYLNNIVMSWPQTDSHFWTHNIQTVLRFIQGFRSNHSKTLLYT